jgi:hypothetical protein
VARAFVEVNERAARRMLHSLSLCIHTPPQHPSTRHDNMDPDTGTVKVSTRQIKPDVLLEVGEKRTVKGAAKDPYVQKR